MISKEELSSQKYDLEKIINDSLSFEYNFNAILWNEKDDKCIQEEQSEHDSTSSMCSNISLWIRMARSSYIAPAYCFNEYIDALVLDQWWDDIKDNIDEENWISSTLREYKKNIEFQNCLLSLKMGLDRFVSLFSQYYKGISNHSTFGHLSTDEQGKIKSKGFMSYVLSKRETDDMFAYIYDQYNEWIQECVFPRDAIVHYQDSLICHIFSWDTMKETGFDSSIHINCKEGQYSVLDHEKLKHYTDCFYSFFANIMEYLDKRKELRFK